MQTFEVVGELSRVGFDAKSTLHDFTGVTSQVAGTFRANLASPSGAWTGEVACAAATLVSGVDGRDDAMRDHLDTAHHAQIRFAIAGFTPAADGIDTKAQTFRGEVRGTMTIRGKSREVAMPITARVDESKRLVVEGQMPLKLSDYGVPVPNKLGLVKVEDEVKVWIALRARVRSGGSSGK
jgi:polyisoprenoid-binding protein YceI